MNDAVLDASVTVALVYPDQYTEPAQALIADIARAHQRMYGPPLLPIEMVNLIRKRMRADRMTLDQASVLLDEFFAYRVEIVQPPLLHHHALALTERYSLSGYDAHYVALAETLGRDFWTGDQRLMRAIGGRLPFVRFVGDYQP